MSQCVFKKLAFQHLFEQPFLHVFGKVITSPYILLFPASSDKVPHYFPDCFSQLKAIIETEDRAFRRNFA